MTVQLVEHRPSAPPDLHSPTRPPPRSTDGALNFEALREAYWMIRHRSGLPPEEMLARYRSRLLRRGLDEATIDTRVSAIQQFFADALGELESQSPGREHE